MRRNAQRRAGERFTTAALYYIGIEVPPRKGAQFSMTYTTDTDKRRAIRKCRDKLRGLSARAVRRGAAGTRVGGVYTLAPDTGRVRAIHFEALRVPEVTTPIIGRDATHAKTGRVLNHAGRHAKGYRH